MKFDPRVTNGIAIAITAVWAASFLADIAVTDYDPSPFLHMVMMGLAGAIFGRAFLGGSDDKDPKR